MQTTQILDMLRYKQWADNRALDAIARIDSERFPAETAFALQQLNHMVRVEEVFRARLLGKAEPHLTSNSDVVPVLNELGERLAESNDWLQTHARSLAKASLAEPIHFHFLDGKGGTMSRAEVFFHLINHGTYHRGAIGHALDLAGNIRPADTYTVFIHSAEPGRRNAG